MISIFQATGVAPRILKIKATEAIALSADVRISDRDRHFGIGKTSLRYLEGLPVSYVKIDSSRHIFFYKRGNTTLLTFFLITHKAQPLL